MNETVITQNKPVLPPDFLSYIEEKLRHKNGRPHIVQELQRWGDPQDQVLNILELVWLKARSVGSVARKYKTGYHTVYRLVQDLDPWKDQIIIFLKLTPRRKMFYNSELGTSDYPTVQQYIHRAKRDGLKGQDFRSNLNRAKKVWTFLKYKDPAKWSADGVLTYLMTLSKGARPGNLDAVRKVCPQIRNKDSTEYISTNHPKVGRGLLKLRKVEVFGKEMKLITKALKHHKLTQHIIFLHLHIETGAREGSRDSDSGMTGLTWERFSKDFTQVDLYETKTKSGVWWRECPLGLLFADLPQKLRKLWVQRGRPVTDKILLKGYPELTKIYKDIRNCLAEYYDGKLEPSVYQSLTNLKPHDADKIHVNLLWEAGIPLEVVGGKYLGGSEGIGLFGRGWQNINIIKKHYLTLSGRSERIQKLRQQVREYSQRFNGT